MVEKGLSRRDFFIGASGLVMGGVGGAYGLREYQQRHPTRAAYNDHRAYLVHALDVDGDYRTVEFPTQELSVYRESRFESLTYEDSPLSLDWSEDGDASGNFLADERYPYMAQVYGLFDENVSLMPLHIIVHDQRYLLPLIRSEKCATGGLLLGDLSGNTDIKIESDDEQFYPGSISLTMTKLVTPDNLAGNFTRNIIRNTPVVYLRDDNKDDQINDVPVSIHLASYYNAASQQDRVVEYQMRYLAESNEHAPVQLGSEMGRVWDRDTVSLIKFSPQPEMTILETAHMDKGHVIVVDNQYREPHSLEFGERWRYQVVESNNMVSAKISGDLAFAYLPDELLPLTVSQRLSRELAIGALSFREYVREGRIDRAHPLVVEFVSSTGISVA